MCEFGLHWQDCGSEGGNRDGFCEKLLAASSASDRDIVSHLPDGPDADRGKRNQQQWQCLCDNISKKGVGVGNIVQEHL